MLRTCFVDKSSISRCDTIVEKLYRWQCPSKVYSKRMRSSKLIQRSEKRVSKYQRTLNILNYLTCNLIEPRIFKLSILPSKSCYQSHLPTGFQLFERGKERGDFRVIDGDTRTTERSYLFFILLRVASHWMDGGKGGGTYRSAKVSRWKEACFAIFN